MGYNVVDLIDKAINIAIRKRAIYENIEQEKRNTPCIQIISKVLLKQTDKTIEYYKTLKKEVADKEFEEIDFGIYDKMSFLINEFNKKIYIIEVSNVRDYLKFSLDLERDIHSLFIDIQGRFVKNSSDIHTKTYEILGDMINTKAEYIKTIEQTLK